MRTRLFLVLAVGLLMAPGTPKDDAAKKEYEKFTGTWRIVSFEMEGTKADAEELKDSRLVLKGDKFTMSLGPMSYGGTYQVDPTKKPRTMDVTFTDGPDKGKTLLAIYELDGDIYKVCIAEPGKERPKEFTSAKGSGCALEVFKREKQ